MRLLLETHALLWWLDDSDFDPEENSTRIDSHRSRR